MLTASAPGNLFIGGEHSIVYPGHSAIITSVGMRTQCSLAGRKDDRIVVYSGGYGKINDSIEDIASRQFNIEDFKRDEMNLTRSLIQRYMKSFGKFPSGFDMYVETEIPKTCKGLSRSTSFLCSAYKALSLLSSIPIDEDSYRVRILPLQREAHGGAASGVEIISSVFGGFHRVNIDGTRENLGKPEFNVVIGDTGIEAKTSDTVPYVRSGWEKDQESYEEVFHRIDDIIGQETRAIKNNNIIELGELMNQNHEILARDLGVSHPKLNKLVDACREAGAYGAKSTGGGKGGAMFALTGKENEKRIMNAILKVGGKPYSTRIGVEGLR